MKEKTQHYEDRLARLSEELETLRRQEIRFRNFNNLVVADVKKVNIKTDLSHPSFALKLSTVTFKHIAGVLTACDNDLSLAAKVLGVKMPKLKRTMSALRLEGYEFPETSTRRKNNAGSKGGQRLQGDAASKVKNLDDKDGNREVDEEDDEASDESFTENDGEEEEEG